MAIRSSHTLWVAARTSVHEQRRAMKVRRLSSGRVRWRMSGAVSTRAATALSAATDAARFERVSRISPFGREDAGEGGRDGGALAAALFLALADV